VKLRFLQLIASLFWGYQTELLLWAIPMGLILELRFLTRWRWELKQADFYKIADLTSLALLGTIIFLFLNAREYHFITALVQWLPLIFFPLVVVFAYSTTQRMPLDVLFHSLRRQQSPVSQSWDLDYLFFSLCLVASGMNSEHRELYLPIVGSLLMLTMLRLRSTRYQLPTWLALVAIIICLTLAIQTGLRETHLVLRAKTQAWIEQMVQNRTDPTRNRTSIGAIGQLKLSDAIKLRLAVEPGTRPPDLLVEAVYDIPDGPLWLTMRPEFQTVPSSAEFRWDLNSPIGRETKATFYPTFDNDAPLLALPWDITVVEELTAIGLQKSLLGVVQAQGLVPSPYFRVRYDTGANSGSLPSDTEVYVPTSQIDVLAATISQHKSAGPEPLDVIDAIFAGFHYSLILNGDPENPLQEFLTQRKTGHCEHYATATVLLLRQMGIPARYVVGYAVQEYSPFLEMYVVRQRHAHAWAMAYLDDHWQVVDTTPATWAANEAEKASILRPAIDLLANLNFLAGRWWSEQRIANYERLLFAISGLLALFLVWRISRSKQVNVKAPKVLDAPTEDIAGRESAYFDIERLLTARGLYRAPGELPQQWAIRVGHPELLDLLHLHQRWRFDPRGLPVGEQRQLRALVNDWLAHDRTRAANDALRTSD
jgi:transglutaminase-like putative cysteine protease